MPHRHDDSAETATGTALFQPSLWVRLEAEPCLQNSESPPSTPSTQPLQNETFCESFSDGDDEDDEYLTDDDECKDECKGEPSTTKSAGSFEKHSTYSSLWAVKSRSQKMVMAKTLSSPCYRGASKRIRQRRFSYNALDTVASTRQGIFKGSTPTQTNSVRHARRQAYLTRIIRTKVSERSPLAELRWCRAIISKGAINQDVCIQRNPLSRSGLIPPAQYFTAKIQCCPQAKPL